MIFLDLVGGGGKAKDELSLAVAAAVVVAAEERLRALTASLGCIGYGVLGDVVETGDSGALAWRLAALFVWCKAGSGSSRFIFRDDSCLVPSIPRMSVDETGVGGNAVLGIFVMLESNPWRMMLVAGRTRYIIRFQQVWLVHSGYMMNGSAGNGLLCQPADRAGNDTV